MKRISIISTLFALFFLVGAASAQHVKVIDGTRLGTVTPAGQTAQIYRYVNGTWTVLSSDAAVVQAGSTIRLRIAATNNRGKLIVGVDNAKNVDSRGGTLYVGTDLGVYQVPCTAVESAGLTWTGPTTLTTSATIGGSSSAKVTISGGAGNDTVYNWKTDPAWKGTCRVLTMKLRDGSEVRARVSFR